MSGTPAARAEEAERTEAAGTPLHERIDQLIDAAAIGPLAPACSDQEFLRRISLDLTGVIPTAGQVRSFLADPAPDKRARVIDELLASPEFSRHMAIQLDVWLLERQTDKHIEVQDWRRYLIASIAESKPLDQLFRELIAGDRIAPETRAATKFLLNREAEPHAVTRDVGRLAFGMDLQCAQCHDHPLIDDYYQEDYYGLFAFVHRTSLFTDPKSKQVHLSEKADGEASFQSVFTGLGRERAVPRLLKGRALLSEPTFEEEEAYRTKPEKNAAGVPKYSRRETLAEMLADSRHFQRNLANRLWAQMFGRGIVHPIDFHHSGNPPVNPALLDLLADALVAGDFQLRDLLREMALTRAYQRACDAPRPATVNFADIAARGERLTRDKKDASAAVDQLKEAATQAQAAFRSALDQNETLTAKLPELEATLNTAKQALEKTRAAQESAEQNLMRVQQQSHAVNAALEQTNAAVTTLPEDTALADAAAVIAAKAKELDSAVKEAGATAAEATTQAKAAAAAVAQAETALEDARAKRVAPEKLAELDRAQLAATRQLAAAEDARRAIDSQLALCRAAAEYAALADSDPAAAEAKWRSLLQRWTARGQFAALRPLTPEQLAASTLRATGMLASQLAAAEAKLDESPPEILKNAEDSQRPQVRAYLLQQELLNQLRPTIDQFVSHYGGLPGEDFQATVNQALFFGNSSTVEGWLRPAGENLASRLGAIEETAELADQLYLSVLSRPARESEKQEIGALLSDYQGERTQAISELIWALLSSIEFRFNH